MPEIIHAKNELRGFRIASHTKCQKHAHVMACLWPLFPCTRITLQASYAPKLLESFTSHYQITLLVTMTATEVAPRRILLPLEKLSFRKMWSRSRFKLRANMKLKLYRKLRNIMLTCRKLYLRKMNQRVPDSVPYKGPKERSRHGPLVGSFPLRSNYSSSFV